MSFDNFNWADVEDFLVLNKPYLHPSNEKCYIKCDYEAKRHRIWMKTIGLPELLPCDVIHPLEDAYYEYWKDRTPYSKSVARAVEIHRRKYEKAKFGKGISV